MRYSWSAFSLGAFTVALLLTRPAGAGAGRVVLEDFSNTAYGVRWSTLSFSKHTDPILKQVEQNGNAFGRVMLPRGGSIFLITQRETRRWDGIRGKPHRRIPGVPTRIGLSVRPQGGDVDVKIVLRDSKKKGRKEIRVPLGKASPITSIREAHEEWRVLEAEIPLEGMKLPVELVGIELARPGEVSKEARPVDLDDVFVTTDISAIGPVYVRARLAAPGTHFVPDVEIPVQIIFDNPSQKARSVTCRLAFGRRGDAESMIRNEDQTVSVPANGHISRSDTSFIFKEPGIYEIEVAAEASGRTVLEKKIEVPVFRKNPIDPKTLEDERRSRERLSGLLETEAAFRVYRTNLCPAIRIETQESAISLFGGINEQRLSVPSHVAIPERARIAPAAAGVRVYETDKVPRPPSLDKPWLLFWFAKSRGWESVHLNVRGRRVHAPIDVPWLVVLDRPPTAVKTEEDRILVDFDGPANVIHLVPLYGARVLDLAETNRWIGAFPKEVAEHASSWARRLKAYPVYVREDFRADPVNDTVQVRQRFDFREDIDAWGTKPEVFAPVPPMLALARRHGFPVTFETVEGEPLDVVDGGISTCVGPVEGFPGVRSYVYKISGVLGYANEDVQPVLAGGGPAADRLRELIRTDTPNGKEFLCSVSRWQPGNLVREDYGIALVGNSERQGLLGSTIPYVDEEEAVFRKRTLKADALFMLNPNNHAYRQDARTGRVYVMEGRCHGRFRNWVDINAFNGGILRALFYYGKYTGDWDLIRQHWPFIRSVFYAICDFKRHGEWECCCFDTGGGDTWDSTWNGTVSFMRMADRLGDAESYRYAAYYLAKKTATLAGMRRANKWTKSHRHWPAVTQEVTPHPDGTLTGMYFWKNPVMTFEDLTFSDVWGINYGLRPWNEPVWMRGSRAEYRMAKDIVPEYARYWLTDRVKKACPEWYERVIVRQERPTGNEVDLRTGEKVVHKAGDFCGKINLQARAIVLGERAEKLMRYLDLGVPAFAGDGRVPRLCKYVGLLEDATGQPYVRLYGKKPEQVSPGWERGRDAYMDLGDGPYLYSYWLGEDGVKAIWREWIAPRRKGKNFDLGSFGPAPGRSVRDVKNTGLNWNTTVMQGRVE